MHNDTMPKVIVILFTLAVMCGCQSTIKKDSDLDADMKKWQSLAENSKGYSPTKKPSYKMDTTPIIKDNAASDKVSSVIGGVSGAGKELPKTKTNLKVRKADIRAVLRAMASSERINLLIKDNVVGVITVDFTNTRWDTVFTTILKSYGLDYIWDDNIIRVVKQEDLEQEVKSQSLQERRKEIEQSTKMVEPFESVVVRLNYSNAKDLKENLSDMLFKDKTFKSRGAIKIDEHTNSLIIEAIHEDIVKMIKMIEYLDRPTPQILIKANIVETTKTVARDLGIQWGGLYASQIARGNSLYITPGGTTTASSGSSSSSATNSSSVIYQPAFGSPGLSQQGFGVNFPIPTTVSQAAGGLGSLGLMYGVLGSNILEVQLQALQEDGKLNIISSPSITTLDNMKAYTENGDKVPYVSISTSGGAQTQTVNFIDAVLRLEITPHVIDNDTLKMLILVKKDEVDTTRSVQGNPYIIKKETSTSLIVQDGETIVISGLTKENRQRSNTGIPLLKDIPVLGNLFGGSQLNDTFQEVLIFITPHILPSRPPDLVLNQQLPNEQPQEQPELPLKD
ncbi:MAG: type IV pilus secretin PilQ [Candidatus Magnetominusculus sp. LBB02]|nr:type IV pilus secretin PilQ [Candidatus Magnetominusculus sp. LBB02]